MQAYVKNALSYTLNLNHAHVELLLWNLLLSVALWLQNAIALAIKWCNVGINAFKFVIMENVDAYKKWKLHADVVFQR